MSIARRCAPIRKTTTGHAHDAGACNAKVCVQNARSKNANTSGSFADVKASPGIIFIYLMSPFGITLLLQWLFQLLLPETVCPLLIKV